MTQTNRQEAVGHSDTHSYSMANTHTVTITYPYQAQSLKQAVGHAVTQTDRQTDGQEAVRYTVSQ